MIIGTHRTILAPLKSNSKVDSTSHYKNINCSLIPYVNNNKTLCAQIHDLLSIAFNLPINWYVWSNKVKATSLSRLSILSLSYRSFYYISN